MQRLMQAHVNQVRWCSKQYTIQNAHKWNDIKLEDVDSILDCDRLDIFYNLDSLVSWKNKTDNIKHKMWNLLHSAYAILYFTT